MKRLRVLAVILLVFAFAAPTLSAPITIPAAQAYPAQIDGDFFGWILQQFQLFFEWLWGGLQALINFIGDLVGGFIRLVLGFFEWFFTVLWGGLKAIIQWLIDGALTVWGWLVAGLRLIGELILIGLLIIQIIIGLGWILIAYIGQLISILGGLIVSFTTAAPTAIPGIPTCVSAPLNYELCAAWYVFEWTLFSGDVGNVIISIIILYIDLNTLFYVFRAVLKIIRRGESITNV